MPGAFETVLGEIEERDLVARAAVSQARNPEQAGKANTLARRQGLPAEVVERNLDEVENRDRFERNKKILDRYPIISSWSVNPRNAAVAVDDYETLGRVGKVFDQVKSFGARTLTRTTGGLYGLIEGASDILEPVVLKSTQDAQRRVFGDTIFGAVSSFARERRKEADAIIAANPNRVENFIGKNLIAGAETVPITLATALATRNPTAVAAAVSAPVAGGEYGRARDKGLGVAQSAIFGASQGLVEFATEKIPASVLVSDIVAKSPFVKTFMSQIVKEVPGEQVATFLQDLNEWATLNPEKSVGDFFRERPLAAAETLVATIGGVGSTSVATKAAEYTVKAGDRLASKFRRADDAQNDAALIDQIGSLAIASKTQTRDPDAFASLIEGLGQSTNVYIPADKVREYLQSDDFSNNDFWDNYADQLDDSSVSGGDVVIPLSAASAYLPGTPAWEALKGDMRLSPGGESLNEADAFNESVGQEFERTAEQVSIELEAENKIAAPRQKLFEAARDKLQNAGERPDVARQQAELIANRYATRAARLGKELTGGEFDSVDVRQILPEGLAPIGKVDNLTIATNIMRGVPTKDRSESLVKFVRSLGGIDDVGGDIESMGFSTIKGIAGKGSKKLIRKTRAEILEASGPSLLGADDRANTNSPDYIAQRAWEAGFFPDFGDRPSVDDLLQALGNDLQIPIESGATESGRRSADALRQLLTESGLDPDTATDAEIRDAVGKYEQSQEGRGYEQLADTIEIDGVQRSTRNSKGQQIAQTEEGVRNFYAWFKDSRVVDDQGRPLVVYHGTNVDIEEFKTDGRWKTEGSGAFFTTSPAVAGTYVGPSPNEDMQGLPLIYPVYLSLENMPTVDFEGKNWNDGPRFYEVRIYGDDSDPAMFESRREAMDYANQLRSDLGDDLPDVDYPIEVVDYPVKLNEDGFFEVDWENIDAENVTTDDFGIGARIAGFEGLRVKNVRDNGGRSVVPEPAGVADMFVAFNPTQIKSVNNVGSFDPADARILYQAYGAAPDGLMGFTSDQSRQKEFGNNNYRYVQPIRVTISGESFDDEIEGLNAPHALERARRNWPAADSVEPLGKGFRVLKQEARGRAVFTENQTIIELFKDRNLSTVIHELGHVWLEELQADAELPDAPDSLKDDWQTVVDWFKANGHDVTDGVIPVEAHELWARGIERYAMEGKAPSSGLRKAFKAFKSWMIGLYEVVNNLRSPITPEIREVMDRLIATDEEINEARNEQNIMTAFDTLEAAQAFGMNEAAYKDYVSLASEARDESFDALLFKTMAAIRRRVTQEYKDARASIIDDVRARVDAQPVFKALSLIKQGQRIDKDWLVEAYGVDALQQLPAGVPPVYIQNGIDPDLLAELSGFQTGDEMVKAFIGIESRRLELREGGDKRSVRQYVIDQEADALMNERFGDPLNDGSIEDEALAAVHSDKQGEVISAELRALGRKGGKAPTPYRIARLWAAQKVSRGIVSDVTSRSAIQRYARAASKAGGAAQEAIASRNNDEAFRQKQIQMLNNALVSEAKQAADNIDAAVKRLSGYAKRRTIKTMDQDYLERIHDLLERVDLKQRSQASEARKGSFSEWAKDQDELGYDVVVPNEFAETLGKTNWSKLSVEALISLDETVKQIAHMGREKQKLLDAKEERDFDEVVNEALDGLKNLPPLTESQFMDAPFAERLKAGVASIDAALLKIETLVDWLDGGNSNGVFNRIVFKPISDAQDNAATMMEVFGGKIADLMNAVPKETIKRWSKRVELPELIKAKTGKPWIMDRSALISMALNMGNEGNIQRLTDGYSWNEANVREVLNRELTQEDWQFVQGVWDTIDQLWPDLSAMERRVNGVAPEKVEAVPIETPFGTFRGGYFPAVYDSSKSERANELDSDKLFSPAYTRATTRSSATKERAAKNDQPILLQLGVINRHMREVIHDITHREAVMQANKFLSSKRVSGAIIEVLGPERYRQFQPWLKYVANQWAYERAGNEGLSKWLGKARANATFVGMGFRASTMLMQIAGLTQSAKVIGPKWVVNGAVAFLNHPFKVGKFAIEKSGELQARLDGMDRDIRSRLLELEGKNAAIDNARRFAFKGIGYMDRLVSIPTWLGAYNKALSEGFDDQQAIYAGDKAIRQSQGSGAAKDLAAVQRGTGKGGEALKLLTMFYSFPSANYQLHRTLGRDVMAKDKRKERDISSLAAQAFFLVILGGILPDLIIGRGPEEDEDWGLWAFQKMLSNSLGPIPIVRDVVPTVANKLADKPVFGYRFTPAQGLQESIIRVAGDVDNLLEGGETTRATRNALELAGYTTGLVPGQLAASTQFLVDLGDGEYDPDGFGDWYEGLTTGKIKEE